MTSFAKHGERASFLTMVSAPTLDEFVKLCSDAPDWPDDFLTRAQAYLSSERVTLLVMDDIEAADHVPANVPRPVEPLRARVSVETLLMIEPPTSQGHRRTQSRS